VVPVTLLVACTKRKQAPLLPTGHFGSLPPQPTAPALAAHWLRTTAAARERRPVRALYAGSGWRCALRAAARGRALGPCELRVVSAGFGLLRLTDTLPAYSASFSAGPDRVADHLPAQTAIRHRHQEWWAAVNTVRGRGPAPLAALPTEQLVVAVGREYLAALEPDLLRRVRERGPAGLHLLCVGAARSALPDQLRPCLLPLDLTVERLLGGPRVTLNVRALDWLLGALIPAVGWKPERLHAAVRAALARGEPPG
jgi:hypothetical protein